MEKIDKKKIEKSRNVKIYSCIVLFLLLLCLICFILTGTAEKIDSLIPQISQSESMVLVAKSITSIGNPFAIVVISTIALLIILLKKGIAQGVKFSIIILGTFIFEVLMKLMIQRPRPENALIEVSGYSFPSGHAAIAVALFISLIFIFNEFNKKYERYTFVLCCIVLVFMIGLSRILLNVHYLSDVLAGFCLGLLWLLFVDLIFDKFLKCLKKFYKSFKKCNLR